MDKRNILLLGFAVVAIGLYVLPNTMSMFVGQHRWYSVRTVSDQIKLCERCHIVEVGEWKANTGAHKVYKDWVKDKSGGVDPGCFCHQVNNTNLASFAFNTSKIPNFGFEQFNASGSINSTDNASWSTAWRTTNTPHAAITIECIDCHYNASTQLSNTNEAHKSFYEQAKNTALNPSLYGRNNTACMACHTMVGLNITMRRIQGGIIINATHNPDYSWTVNVTTNTTNMTGEPKYWAPNVTAIP